MRSRRLSFALALWLGCAASVSAAGDDSLADLSIEQLMSVSVTSVSKREQKLADVASAITVLSNDELQRLGATTVADALRFVPGMDVGTINASHWAISARGFNNLYANKLLVLVDGRAIYTPLFAGVYWDLQQMMLIDVDRIEVIRGPGATIWGANAVNGVINIVTRSARDSQGSVASVAVGDVHETVSGGRYGGRIGERTFYRVFGGYRRDAEGKLTTGGPAADNWQGGRAGFRLDHYTAGGDQLTWRTDAVLSNLDDSQSHAYDANTLARWTRSFSARSGVEAQVYFDRTWRNDTTRSTQDTLDASFQNTFGLGERNDVIWGAGYRHIDVAIDQKLAIANVLDHRLALQLFSGFVQDDFHVVPDRLTLTAGIKLEHNDFTGIEIQPSVRAVFKPSEGQSLWSAISRAVRTPDVIEGRDAVDVFYGAPFQGPGGDTYVPTLSGNPSLKSEVLWAYELGYRIQATDRVHVDVASFYNHYLRVIGINPVPTIFEPGQPFGMAELPWTNIANGHTAGGEVAITASPTDRWRVTAAYAMLYTDLHGAGHSADPTGAESSSPRHQANVRSSYDLATRWTLDGDVRFVDRIAGVPAYVTGDVRLAWHASARWDVSLVGQNLIDHAEQAAIPPYDAATQVRRGFYVKLVGRF